MSQTLESDTPEIPTGIISGSIEEVWSFETMRLVAAIYPKKTHTDIYIYTYIYIYMMAGLVGAQKTIG